MIGSAAMRAADVWIARGVAMKRWHAEPRVTFEPRLREEAVGRCCQCVRFLLGGSKAELFRLLTFDFRRLLARFGTLLGLAWLTRGTAPVIAAIVTVILVRRFGTRPNKSDPANPTYHRVRRAVIVLVYSSARTGRRRDSSRRARVHARRQRSA